MATANSLKLDPVSSFKLKGMMEGGKVDSPTSEALLKKERKFPPQSDATVSMGTVKLFIGGLFLAFILGALVTGTAMHLASGSFNQYLGARPTEFASGSCVWTASGYHCSALPSDLPTEAHGRHLAATCNQFNVAVSGTTFKGTQKMGDSTVGIWEATVTNQCATGPLTSLTVSTDGRYNPAGGSNPRSQTGLQNCSPPTVDKNGVLHGPVTCAVVLPAGGLGAAQSMTIQYLDNNAAAGPAAHTFAVGAAVYAAPAPAPATGTPAPTAGAACNQFNVAVSPTTFQASTKMGDSTVGIWQATITNKCAGLPLTSAVVSTDGRYNPAGGVDPHSQTGLQNCSPPTVDKNGVLHGPVTCQVALPGGSLAAGQSFTFTYVDNNLAGANPAHTFAVSSAAYGTAGAPAGTQTPAAVNCNQFNVAVAPTAFTGTSNVGGGLVGKWQATITNQCAAGKLTSLTVTTSGRFNPAGGIPRSTTNLANCTPPTVDKNGVLHGPVTCQVVLPGGALGAGQSMTVTYTDSNLGGAAAYNFATGMATYAAA